MAKFYVNGEAIQFNASPDTPLLWAIRDHIGLTGTKFGCGMAQCGACTVHVNGEATRSCVTPVSAIEGKRVNTIEGLPDSPVTKAHATSAPHSRRSLSTTSIPLSASARFKSQRMTSGRWERAR